MSDDWGGTVPLPEEDEGASSPQPSPKPSGPKPGRSNTVIGGAVAAVVAVVVVIVLVAGGGGGNKKKASSGSSTTTPVPTATATDTASDKLSKADLIAKATQICNSYHDEINADAQSGDLVDEVGAVEQETSQIRNLGPPAEDADTLDQALAAIDQTTTALRSGDQATAAQANAAAISLLEQFGLGACNPNHTG